MGNFQDEEQREIVYQVGRKKGKMVLNNNPNESGAAYPPIPMGRKDKIQALLWNPAPIPSAKVVTMLFQLLPVVLFLLMILLLLLLLHVE